MTKLSVDALPQVTPASWETHTSPPLSSVEDPKSGAESATSVVASNGFCATSTNTSGNDTVPPDWITGPALNVTPASVLRNIFVTPVLLSGPPATKIRSALVGD